MSGGRDLGYAQEFHAQFLIDSCYYWNSLDEWTTIRDNEA